MTGICPPAPIDRRLQLIFRGLLKKYPGITRSDVIRWGVAALKEYPDIHYVSEEKPMRYKSPAFVIDESDFLYLKERRSKYGITVAQSIRDAIYSASLHH